MTADDTHRADVGIASGKIAAIGLELEAPEILDATDRYVMPGGIDVHTHLDMPLGDIVTADDWESGTVAAACGGTTAIVDFATQEFGRSLHAAVDAWFERAEGKGIENRQMLLYDGGVRSGRIGLDRFVDLVSTRPAKIFGLYPRKGTIAVGADADVLTWSPERRWTISEKTTGCASTTTCTRAAR